MTRESVGFWLATLNAALNATSAVLATVGFVAVKRGERETHARAMKAAFVTSALFLASYLTRAALTGTHRFAGPEALRTPYLALLGSHTLLAIVSTPLVVRALWLGRASAFERHKRIAKLALPLWVYVSITGVAVYALLYHVR